MHSSVVWVVCCVVCAELACSLSHTHVREETVESQASGKTHQADHVALYPTIVDFQLANMVTSEGIAVYFDKTNNGLRVSQMHLSSAGAIAWGRYDDEIRTTGWSELHLAATPSQDIANDVKMYSAGFIEGLLTCLRISEFYSNTQKLVLKKEASSDSLTSIKHLFTMEINHMKAQANVLPRVISEEPITSYHKHLRYILVQIWGICDGYNVAARHFGVHTFTLEDMLLINSVGELPELMQAFSSRVSADRAEMHNSPVGFLQQAPTSSHIFRSSDGKVEEDLLDSAHWERRVAGSGRCSALVRVTAADRDLLVAHATWGDYSEMTRIFKYYKFPLPGSNTTASHIAFSSYPGLVSSTDDFYVLDSGLTVLDTSLELLDPRLWTKALNFPLHPHIPNFAHVMITNRLATSASHWADLYSSVNVGTNSAQWMVVDYNLFEPGMSVRNNTLWVVEAIPGMMHKEDMSHVLRSNGYWPSFNRPFFSAIREASGHAAAERSHGELYSWSKNPRAKIFAGMAKRTNSLPNMRGVMVNHFYSENILGLDSSPAHSVSARMDLSPQVSIPNGGIDAKVVNRCLVAKLQVQAESGPSHENQPIFQWPDWRDWPHVGLPDVWNFTFVQMNPSSEATALIDASIC